MVLGDCFIEEVRADGRKLKTAPLAVEPVSDIAVLGSLDTQTFSEDADDFEAFCANMKPVPLCTEEFEEFEPVPIHVFTHKGTWLQGTAQQCRKDAHMLSIQTDEQIEGGTSGGPVITDDGLLLGIVSNASVGQSDGSIPRPHLCLPCWTLRAGLLPDSTPPTRL